MTGFSADFLTLGIETSCDDTSAAVLRGERDILSSVVSSQTAVHGPYGGVVPELASREHVRNISPVVGEALRRAGVTRSQLQLISVTRGPGLVGSLLVGLNYAKATARVLNIPFTGVNHLEGHFFSPLLEHPGIEFPAFCLLVSGGHSSLYLAPAPGQYRLLTATRDDAAGEAFDKAAKMLGLPYPGGPVIDRLASGCAEPGFKFSLPKISDGSLDFSFSGLKTSLLQILRKEGIGPAASPEELDPRVLPLLKGFQEAVVAQLLDRIVRFSREHRPRSLLLGGGVACNSALRRMSREAVADGLGIPVYFPSPALTTDNAAMIALAGLFHYRQGRCSGFNENACPSLRL